MEKWPVKTYLRNPYNSKGPESKKRTHLTSDGRIWKNSYLKFDMTSQRGNK